MSNEAVTVAKERINETDDRMRVLEDGTRIRLRPVPQVAIQDGIALLEEPRVPMWQNPDKDGREEPNPMDPDYLQARERYEREKHRVTFDVTAMFAIELVDGLPENDDWLSQLRLMARLGRLDLDPFDLDDPIDLEYLYKRFRALSNEMYIEIGMLSGLSQSEVSRAARSFRGHEKRGTD